jgi:hypothetical protein
VWRHLKEEEDLGEIGEDSRAHVLLAGMRESVPVAANEVLQQVEPKEPLCIPRQTPYKTPTISITRWRAGQHPPCAAGVQVTYDFVGEVLVHESVGVQLMGHVRLFELVQELCRRGA